MTITRIAAAMAEDDPVQQEEIEINTQSEIGGESVAYISSFDDTFKNVNIKKQSKKVKSRFYRLRKKFEGIEGAESKYNELDNVDGYGLYAVAEPPYSLEALAGLLDISAIHQAAINARTMNTVGLGYVWEKTLKGKKKVERASGDSDKEKNARKFFVNEEEKVEEMLDSFNEEETLTESLIKVWIDTLAMGNGYLEIGRTRDGSIGYIGHVPGAGVRVRRQRDGFVQITGNKAVFFRNFQDEETDDPINNDPRPNELIHFKFYSPSNNFYGIPPAVSAIAAITGDKFAKDYNIDYFENKAIPRYALIIKGGKLSVKSKQAVVNYFKNEVKGNHHGTLVIPIPATMGKDVDIKFQALENGIQDQSFDKYRKSNRDEIVIAHRVPAPKVGIYDNANLAVSRDADKTFKMQVIGPDQRVIEKRINRIIAELTDFLKFKFDEIDIIDEDLRSRIHDRYLRTEVLKPNEVREDIGKEPIEGGDEVLPYPPKAKLQGGSSGSGVGAPIGNNNAQGHGAPVGNTNAQGASPPRSRQDSNSTESTPESSTGTARERGQAQDVGEGSKS